MTQEEINLLRELNEFIKNNGLQIPHLKHVQDMLAFVQQEKYQQLLQDTIHNLHNPALHPELTGLASNAPKPKPIFSDQSVELIESWIPNPNTAQGLNIDSNGNNELGEPVQVKKANLRPKLLPPGTDYNS